MPNQQIKANMKPLGDSALIVQLGEGIDPKIHEMVKNLSELLTKHPFDGFIEYVPAYNNMTVYYNPYIVHISQKDERTAFEKVCVHMNRLINQIHINTNEKGRLVSIPVCYGGEFGPDLESVAKYHQITPEEVVRIHTESECLVYMLGFAPGFPFMGGMNPLIATPRKETPRLSIKPGSVGIAGKQTGIYSLETPGGWQIIGRTPLSLFLPDQSPPTLLKAGDRIQFTPISSSDYIKYKEMG
ncbi:5-oxoprolinase subunit PxpB [Psychrobacillus soli]|uniref:5-oxoprolinase subunit PxpB n=1 Tax=Psychrobacillus soli TaxID=1543965 RepID=A0A544SRE6_9BACI|nr:5-oxoprolinase subunit PxpB [Psychrobacillus soli]TQR07780.1 5-oxoprolinase subunit PxpB [Psychrobacillus soli]